MSARWRSAPFAVALGAGLSYAVACAPAGRRAAPYILLHLALAALQLGLSRALAREGAGPSRIGTHILLASVIARFALVLVPSFTTTDVGRYLWDGAVVRAGMDPYAHAPGSAALASVRASWPLPEDHHDVVGCYPPLAEALFALCALAGPALAPALWKLLVAAVSSLAARSLWLASRDGRARAASLLWLAHPLVLLEGGVGAHLDVLTGALILWAILAAERDRWTEAALLLGGAVSIKLTPAVLCVALWPRASSRWRWPLACALLPALTVGVPWALGAALPGSLPLVARHWSFGAPLWSALYALWPTRDDAIRPALALLGAALVLAQWLRPRATHAEVGRDALLAYAVTNPTMYPWYLAPALACAARAPWVPRAPSVALWALCAVAPLSYEVIDRYQSHGQWAPARWPLWLSALAPLAALGALGLSKPLSPGASRARP